MTMKKVIRIIIVILLAAMPLYNLYFSLAYKTAAVSAKEIDLSALKAYESVDIASIQKKIDTAAEKNEDARKLDELMELRSGGIAEVLAQIESGETTYDEILGDCLIVGDSLIEAINAFNLLDESLVMGQVSASLYHLNQIKNDIIAYQPKVVIMHYGENHLSDSDEILQAYIDLYMQLINEMKESLPDTRFVVSGTFHADDYGIGNEPYLAYVDKYNAELEKMCAELGVDYLDNSPLLPGDDSYYDGDGIHVVAAFYTELWFPYLITTLGL